MTKYRKILRLSSLRISHASDHSDPLLSADLCNKLMHDDASFGSF